MPRGGWAAALVGAALGLAVLAGCGDDDASPIVLTGAGAEQVTGASSSVQLPVGRVEFQVKEPGPVEEDAVDDAEGVDPDASYVGISWDFTAGAGIPDGLGGFFVENDVPAPVSVAVDGEVHELGLAYDVPGEAASATTHYVKVGDDVSLDDLELRVEFAEVTQSVTPDGESREPGRAAGIYELPEKSTPARCRATIAPGSASGDPRCVVAGVQLPYLSGQGWAPEGEAWTVVDASTVLKEVHTAGEVDSVLRLSGETRLDGAEPEAVLVEDDGVAGTLHTQVGFLTAPDDPLRLELTRQVDTGTGSKNEITMKAVVELARAVG